MLKLKKTSFLHTNTKVGKVVQAEESIHVMKETILGMMNRKTITCQTASEIKMMISKKRWYMKTQTIKSPLLRQ